MTGVSRHLPYPVKPGYSHGVEPGRSDSHFSTAGCGKTTLTPPTDKTERGVGHIQLARSGDHSRTMPLKHGGHCVRALGCHQGMPTPGGGTSAVILLAQ